MKAYFDRDGRKTNTINIPQSEDGLCKKNGFDMCIDPKCSECETKKMGMEYRTIQLLVPVHELSIDTGAYAKWSEWHIFPKDKMPEEYKGDEPRYSVPKAFIDGLKMIATMILDLIKKCEERGQ